MAGNDVTLTVVQPSGVEIDINTTVPNVEWHDPIDVVIPAVTGGNILLLRLSLIRRCIQ